MGVNFSYATFREEAEFRYAQFDEEIRFSHTTFDAEVTFGHATFSPYAHSDPASLGNYIRSSAATVSRGFRNHASLDFQYAKTARPDHISFHNATLRPVWFVNIDASKFNFINVRWENLSISKAINELKSKNNLYHHRLLSIAYRQLSVNAEENHRYEEASRLRYLSMEAGRREHCRGLALWRLGWWYWAASGYGERVGQAATVLVLLITLFAFAYTRVGFESYGTEAGSAVEHMSMARDEIALPLRKGDALIYSLQVITFQKPEPRPLARAARVLVAIESIVGPIQAALLALAVRRKFIR
jgi:hypothetical protein